MTIPTSLHGASPFDCGSLDGILLEQAAKMQELIDKMSPREPQKASKPFFHLAEETRRPWSVQRCKGFVFSCREGCFITPSLNST